MAPNFQVADVDVKAERRRQRLKAAALSVASVVVLIVGGGAAWYFTPPAMPETLEQARAMVNSARFQRLSQEDKRPYMDTIREQFGSLDHDERRKMMENDEAMRNAMRDARTAQMDEMVKKWAMMPAEQRAGFSMWGNRGERRERPEREDRPEPTEQEKAERAQRGKEMINDRFANGDAQANQLIGEFFHERRKHREGNR